jgi:hypothetical protein
MKIFAYTFLEIEFGKKPPPKLQKPEMGIGAYYASRQAIKTKIKLDTTVKWSETPTDIKIDFK